MFLSSSLASRTCLSSQPHHHDHQHHQEKRKHYIYKYHGNMESSGSWIFPQQVDRQRTTPYLEPGAHASLIHHSTRDRHRSTYISDMSWPSWRALKWYQDAQAWEGANGDVAKSGPIFGPMNARLQCLPHGLPNATMPKPWDSDKYN